MSIFTKGTQSIAASLLLSALALPLLAGPALAQDQFQMQGKNTDLEVFGGGIAKTNPQGFSVGNGIAANPQSGALNMRRDALEKVTWFKSRRQVSIEDDGPIVTDRRTGGGMRVSANLSPAAFGNTNAMGGGMAPRNLSRAQFGPMTRPQMPQARPIMHSGLVASPGKLGPSGGPSYSSSGPSTAPVRPIAQANYGGYGPAPAAAGGYSASSEHIREVKAKLLGNH